MNDIDVITEIHSKEFQIINSMTNKAFKYYFYKSDIKDKSIIDNTVKKSVMPIIVIVNGCGSSGKTTAEQFGNIYSTIDKCKCIVNYMRELSNDNTKDDITNDVMSKTNKYRSLLHDIKMLWVKYYNEPTLNTFYEIYDTIIELPLDELYKNPIYFIDIREKDEIEKMRKIFNEHGICVFTLLIHGRCDPTTYTNDADALCETFDYDFYIENTDDLYSLNSAASVFYNNLIKLNKQFGVTIDEFKEFHNLM